MAVWEDEKFAFANHVTSRTASSASVRCATRFRVMITAELDEAGAKSSLDELQKQYATLVVSFKNQQAELLSCQAQLLRAENELERHRASRADHTHAHTNTHAFATPAAGHASCQNRRRSPPWLQATPTCCSTLRCVAALCAALQHFALRCSTSRCVAARCALLDAALCLQVAPAYGVRRRRR